MSIESHEKALRAASRVAFLALVGCGGITETPTGSSDRSDNVSSDQNYERPSDEPRPPDYEAASSSSSGASAECADAGRDAAPAASTDAGTPHEPLSCQDQLAAQFPNGDPQWWDGEPGTRVTNAELAACCTDLAVARETDGTLLEDFRNTGCCHVNDWEQGTHCTPWGPPMPPAMRGVA